MKMVITDKEYLQRKVNAHEMFSSDYWYLSLANRLMTEWENSGLLSKFPESGRKEAVLCLTCYLQDISGDIGAWRAFIDHCNTIYGYPVPFYTSEDGSLNLDGEMEEGTYVDYELNFADVCFLLWYSVSFYMPGEWQYIYPYDEELIKLAKILYSELDRSYEDSPLPEGMVKTNDLDMYDPEDAETLTTLGHWIYWASYLMAPAFKTNMYALMQDLKGKGQKEMIQSMGEAQMNLPTGPLALFLREWVWLLVSGELPKPKRKKSDENEAQHSFYEPFIKANNGKRIAFFNDYKSLNEFLHKAFNWDPNEENIPGLKDCHDFTLLVNEKKGMLLARDIARCLAHPDNPCYDKEYAINNAFRLITERGAAPIDLVQYALANNLLPDLRWNGVEGSEILTHDNADFIARCYLLQFYRAD
jgi:hypothetical protein